VFLNNTQRDSYVIVINLIRKFRKRNRTHTGIDLSTTRSVQSEHVSLETCRSERLNTYRITAPLSTDFEARWNVSRNDIPSATVALWSELYRHVLFVYFHSVRAREITMFTRHGIRHDQLLLGDHPPPTPSPPPSIKHLAGYSLGEGLGGRLSPARRPRGVSRRVLSPAPRVYRCVKPLRSLGECIDDFYPAAARFHGQ